MTLPPAFMDTLRARIAMPGLVGRRVRLMKSGRNWKGCCPFHNEKSPSFYVYEDGFHCFGCGAHGDAIAFVMRTEGATFPEAVERLAAEAGLEVPKASREEAIRETRARDLYAVMEAASDTFIRRLRLPEGRAALDYLRRRGLTEETIRAFGLGWSGPGRGSLVADLKDSGITTEQLLDCGLLKEPDDGRPPREAFWDRVMFPIRDRRARLIAFGGRVLGDGHPKYVNSPETSLFSKRRNLYGHDRARHAVHDGARLLVAEGYMDVIALHQAGFGGAVAPLGTALTEEQMAELWRMAPEPVLCFDGDSAGQKAAFRAAEGALPALTPERLLRFASLPPGEDPDTLITKSGPEAFRRILDAAEPIEAVLFRLAQTEHPGEGPAPRAARKTRLAAMAAAIADKNLADTMGRELLHRWYGPRRAAPGPRAPWKGRAPAGRDWGLPPRPEITAAAVRNEQTRCLIALLLHHPSLLPEVEEALARLDLPEGPAARLRPVLLAWHDDIQMLDPKGLLAHLGKLGLAEDAAAVLVRNGLPAEALPDAQDAEALAAFWHWHGLLQGRAEIEAALTSAMAAFVASSTAATQAQVVGLRRAAEALFGQIEED
ncbi:DNA primase [Humitalea rosea]|uniref:DNA primase n=1 Tax=Humitalea rosea TaxID=990373 RepID=A0A2W7I333_9PROT|nr:DNA primase [Humitalea rosea]PZW41331.1 DNA primase [Humitalea rosea]